MWPYFKRLQGLRIVTKRKVKMYSIHPTEYDAYVLSRDRAIALCSETIWKKLWPDRKLNFSGHTEVKVHWSKLELKVKLSVEQNVS